LAERLLLRIFRAGEINGPVTLEHSVIEPELDRLARTFAGTRS
jgi:hypothetical protein